MIRDAGLFDCSINGMPMAWFQEKNDSTVTQTTKCYSTKKDAEREIHLFKYGQIYKELAKK